MKKLILGVFVMAFAFSLCMVSAQGIGGGGNTTGYEAEPKTCIESQIETHRCVPNSLESCDVAGQIPC